MLSVKGRPADLEPNLQSRKANPKKRETGILNPIAAEEHNSTRLCKGNLNNYADCGAFRRPTEPLHLRVAYEGKGE